MKKIFSLFAAVLFAGSMMAEVVTLDPATQTPQTSETDINLTIEGIGVAYHGTLNAATQASGQQQAAPADFRVYAGKTLTLTASSNITKVVIAGKANKANFTLTSDKGTVTTGASYADVTEKAELSDPLIVVEEINANSVVLTCGKQLRAYKIEVNLGEAAPVEPKEEFYLTGSFRSWAATADANYKFAATATEGEYALKATFDAAVECKAIGLKEGEDTKWYPAGMENNFALEAGEYTIYLRPAGNAGEGWHEGVLKAEKKEPLAEPTNCAEAAEAALSVESNNDLYNDGKEYTIEGYVTSIQTAYNSQYNNVSFWMADTKDGGKVLEAYRAACATAADAPNEGDKVAVTGKLTKYNTTPEFAAGCTFTILERAEVVPAVNLGEKTIEEFLVLKNTKDTCILTGVVKNIQNTTYGNFDLEDETGTVYVYGLLTAAGEAKKFEEMGIEENDILTIKAVYNEYNGNPQAKNAVFVSVEKGEKPEPQTIELDVVYGEAALYATQGIWQINLYKDYDSETQTVTYPDLYIGVTPKSATTIAGIYSIEEEIAFVEVDVASEQTVTATEATDLEVVCLGDGVYSFYMEFVGDDGNTYVLDAEVPILAYNAESEEGEEIELEDDPETGVETTKVADKAVKFIENATLLIERNGVRYNVMGQVVR